ncbi:MAG TPA: lytic transglycosylase domain-containing protein [Pyrinomonadaceae bacterium]
MGPHCTSRHPLRGGTRSFVPRLALVCFALLLPLSSAPALAADRLHLKDGAVIEVDEAWEDAEGVWFRRAGVTQFIGRERVRRIERVSGAEGAAGVKPAPAVEAVKGSDVTAPPPAVKTVWLYLVGGAKMEVDEANESAEGVWFRRANLSSFIEKSRVERVEYAPLASAGETSGGERGRAYGWTTGSAGLDELIRQNGARYGVDPYLIFCVIEQESHFNPRAVSPVGARGLMQLMPATARRFGVRSVHDPAQNVSGGTRYLKELLGMFGGRLDLVLAGYNAGEGTVMKYGRRVPPYRETQNYVKRIGARYGRTSAVAPAKESGGVSSPASAVSQ